MTGGLLITFLIVRRLTSVTFSLSSPLSPSTHLYTLAYIHTFAGAESSLPKHLCHLSLSSLKLFAVALLLPLRHEGTNRTRWAEKGKDGEDAPFIGEGSYVLKGAALAAKTFL